MFSVKTDGFQLGGFQGLLSFLARVRLEAEGFIPSTYTNFWDPGGFTADGNSDNFARRRQMELKHGRVSMLGTNGYITPDSAGKLPGYLSPSAGLKFVIAPQGGAPAKNRQFDAGVVVGGSGRDFVGHILEALYLRTAAGSLLFEGVSVAMLDSVFRSNRAALGFNDLTLVPHGLRHAGPSHVFPLPSGWPPRITGEGALSLSRLGAQVREACYAVAPVGQSFSIRSQPL